MKAKDAAKSLKDKHVLEVDLAHLYHEELMQRANNRWRSGTIPMAGFCALLKEMNEWVTIVCRELGMTKGQAKNLMRIFNEQAYTSAERALTQHAVTKGGNI